MRLDKYLKVSRIIKRRTVACELAEHGRVMVNGRIAKPSTNVKIGDIIILNNANREIRYEVLEVRENIRSNETTQLYRIL